MATSVKTEPNPPIQHPGEEKSNDIRRRLVGVEPLTQRTYTPSLIALDKSAGWHHYTPDGRKLVDFTSGVLVTNLGHNPASWWRRVVDYMGLGGLAEASGPFVDAAPLTAYNAVTDLEVLACERLLANMQSQPGGQRMERVCWAASGSEAIQKALWGAMSRREGRDVIVATRRGFHGKKGLAGATTGGEEDPERDERVRFVGFPIEECIDVERRAQPIDLAPYKEELAKIVDEVGSRLCCLITEPYLGGGGSYHPQKEYLQLLQDFCREHDMVFILDEIQSCFGRTGPMYAFSRYGIEPDVVALGKGMGNGVPVSAAVGRDDVFASLDYGEGSDTFSANPLAASSVLATLDEFDAADVLGQAQKLSQALEEGLIRLKQTGLVSHIRGEGCVWGVHCAPVAGHSANETANAIVKACYLGDESGRAIHLLGPLAGSVIRISPPLVLPADEARECLETMFRICQNVNQ